MKAEKATRREEGVGEEGRDGELEEREEKEKERGSEKGEREEVEREERGCMYIPNSIYSQFCFLGV